MAPSFLSKFVKNNNSSNDRHERSRSTSLSRNPSISITVPASIAKPVTITASSGRDDTSFHSDTSSSTNNLNVTVIPPSPLPSERSLSDQSTKGSPGNSRRPAPVAGAPLVAVDNPASSNSSKKPMRRIHSLSLGSQPVKRPNDDPEEDSNSVDAVFSIPEDPSTPTPGARQQPPSMPARSDTIRPLSHASSTGDLREAAGQAVKSPSRSQTISPFHSFTNVTSPAVSQSGSLSSKSSKSKISLKLNLEPPQLNRHERSATAPPDGAHVRIDPPADSPPIVESPTHMSGSMMDFIPPKPGLSASMTMPNNLPNSSLLGLPDVSDAASIHSVSSSTTKKRRSWRRSSTAKEPSTPTTSPTSRGPSAASPGSKSPKRQPTGLAGAIAMSSMAMINPHMSIPNISPTESSPTPTASRNTRTGSTSSPPATSNGHRSRASIDGNLGTPPNGSRSRHPSLSYPTSDMSDRDSFHSGVDESGSSEGEEDGVVGSEEASDDLDMDADDIPVTGFAVASNIRNQEFHRMFQGVPEGDYLIEDYGCALQREILIQGRLYISENHVCFHANIFGWTTDLVIPMYDVIALDKRMTAFVIPNAIAITTRNLKYTFTSFLSRDTTYDVMYNVWRLARPEDESLSSLAASPMSPSQTSVNSATSGTTGALIPPSLSGGGGMNGRTNSGSSAGSGASNGASRGRTGVNKVTRCSCQSHFSEVAMETVLPGTPERIYGLMFTSGFIKEFMRNEQKLTDIQISDWMPLSDNNPSLLARNMSYIKPLTAPVGPKQTKCELRDELQHCDFDQYVTMMTITRTPNVPSGGVFSVKTKTCITWASDLSSKVLVTTQVEWTGRSFIRGIIEKSCLEGQKTYHVDLDNAMRDYIHKHHSEFIPEGVDVAQVEESAVAAAAAAVESDLVPPKTPTAASGPAGFPTQLTDEQARKAREKERNQRGLQWAYDTFEGAFKVAKQSTEGAFELVSDAWDQSSMSTILYFIITLLVISNMWTLMMMGKREEIGRRKELKKAEEREKWVQDVVHSLWDELAASRAQTQAAVAAAAAAGANVAAAGVGGLPLPIIPNVPRHGADWRAEVAEMSRVLDAVEERMRTMRESIKGMTMDLD